MSGRRFWRDRKPAYNIGYQFGYEDGANAVADRIKALLDDPSACWEPGLIHACEIRRALGRFK